MKLGVGRLCVAEENCRGAVIHLGPRMRQRVAVGITARSAVQGDRRMLVHGLIRTGRGDWVVVHVGDVHRGAVHDVFEGIARSRLILRERIIDAQLEDEGRNRPGCAISPQRTEQ